MKNSSINFCIEGEVTMDDRIIDGKLERQIERIKGEDDNVKEET